MQRNSGSNIGQLTKLLFASAKLLKWLWPEVLPCLHYK
jgi:hypothetical protein